MSREEFLNMMDGRIPADRSVIGELSGLTELFPWFQGARLLLLKALKDSEDFRFDSQLRNSAVYIADREHLYYYLRGLPEGPEPKPVAPQMPGSAEVPWVEQEPAAETEAVQPGQAPELTAEAVLVEQSPEVTTEALQIEQEPSVNMEAYPEEDITEATGHSILIPGDTETDEAPGIMLITDEVTEAIPGTGDMAIPESDFDIDEDTELLELIDEDVPEETVSMPASGRQIRNKRDMQTDL
ncbi:MAG: hypothetical protein MUD02_08975, partial [Bacteroidales bacterium]|nr:hypothetical protein [Bacteroidales bacterium]